MDIGLFLKEVNQKEYEIISIVPRGTETLVFYKINKEKPTLDKLKADAEWVEKIKKEKNKK